MRGRLRAENLWLPEGWRRGVVIDAGAGDEVAARFVLPGMPNLHSHAFQRVMAGLAERRGPREDSFWTWREAMYAVAARIEPDALRAIAAQLYVEMLKAGYTRVCEFHYLHNTPDGGAYADPATMSLALVEAAREVGIGLTLLPVLYTTGGLDGRPLSSRQRRFGLSVEAYLRLLESLHALESDRMRVGVALHSLRAVPEAAMREVLAAVARSPREATGESARAVGRTPERPIHIHIAEQVGEVQDFLALRGARPVEWLLDHADVDQRWCLVHATHLDDAEVRALATSGAVAGLCPTTEANLGDGLFPLAAYLGAGGILGIGSDSHISVSPVEELRWLEYGQRLIARRRNVAAAQPGASVGEVLWRAAWRGGMQAAGIDADAARGDWIVLDEASPLLAARDAAHAIDSFVFAGNTPLVRDVMAGGEWVVRDFHHRDEARIASAYHQAARALRAEP